MKTLTYARSLVALALAVCTPACGDDEATSTESSSGLPSGQGGGDGSGGGNGSGAGGSGGGGASDPDVDDGPPWDGSAPFTERTLVTEAFRALILDDRAIYVPNGTTDQLWHAPFDGTAPSQVATLPAEMASGYAMLRAGRSVLLQKDGRVDGWSSTRGYVASIDLPFENRMLSEDHTLGVVHSTSPWQAARWNVEQLEGDAIPLGPDTYGLVCAPLASSLLCAESLSSSLRLFAVTSTGVVERGSLARVGESLELISGTDFAVLGMGAKLYRVDLDGEAPAEIASDVGPHPGAAVHQGGWVTYRTATNWKVVRIDGTDAWSPTEGDSYPQRGAGDTRRLSFTAYCDATGLHALDLESRESRFLSADCVLKGISYSDRYVFFLDEVVETPSDPISPRYGTNTIVDLTSGEARQLSGQSFEVSVRSLAKSRWVLDWLAFGYNRNGGYFDGHSVSSADIVPFPGTFKEVVLDADGGGWTVAVSNAQEDRTSITRFDM